MQYFAWYIGDTCVMLQMLSMGFYQLSRLRMLGRSFLEKAPGHKHIIVTKTLLRLLQTVGCCLFISMMPLKLFCRFCLRSSCGIKDKESMDFHSDYVHLVPQQYMDVWTHAFHAVYLLWDAATVLLFAYQILLITKIESENIEIRARIVKTRHALYRVLMNSLFYEMVLLIAFILRSRL